MNKTQLIEKIAKENDLTKKQVAQIVDATVAGIADALAAGESVQFLGFGTFSVKEIAEHNGRNPRTGEVVTIAASRRPAFTASKALKDKLN